MATSRAPGVTVCSICGEPLNAKGACVACLLRTGLEESSTFDTKSPAPLVFGDFEVARREDGSFWELGRGAFGVTYLAVDNVLRRKVALKVIEVPAAARASQSAEAARIRRRAPPCSPPRRRPTAGPRGPEDSSRAERRPPSEACPPSDRSRAPATAATRS